MKRKTGHAGRGLMLAVALAAALMTSSAAAGVKSSVVTEVPVLLVDGDENKGLMGRLPFTFSRDGSDRPLRVVIADDTPNGSSELIRGSLWLAATTAAIIRNDPLDGVRLFVEFSGNIDGPSAGGVMCLAVLQALDGKPMPADFAMTGTIMPDGTIGQVGGVALKIRAAIANGVKRICIPAFCRFERQDDGRYVDLFRLGDEAGVQICPVRSIEEVYRLVNGVDLVRPTGLTEQETLSLPPELDARLVRFGIDYFGDKGLRVSDEEIDYWNKVGEATSFPFWNADAASEEEFWSRISRGKVLSALHSMTEYRALYGDCKTPEEDVFSGYLVMMTNELAVAREVTVGSNTWLAVREPPYDEKQKERMVAWNRFGRTVVALVSGALDERTDESDQFAGYFPDAGNTEIAAQGEDEDRILNRTRGFVKYYNEVLEGRKDPEQMTDAELYEGVQEILGIFFRINRFVLYCQSGALTHSRQLVYGQMPRVRQSAKARLWENMFYSAAVAVAQIMDSDHDEQAENGQVTKSTLVQQIDRCDPQYAILRAEIASMVRDHQILTRPEKMTNATYHVSAALYRQSQVLARACATQVRFGPDAEYDFETDEIGNREFVYYLARMARISAIRSIGACKLANIPCIDPILRLELGDEALSDKDSDLISDCLENYWNAYLGAKALVMGFECIPPPTRQ